MVCASPCKYPQSKNTAFRWILLECADSRQIHGYLAKEQALFGPSFMSAAPEDRKAKIGESSRRCDEARRCAEDGGEDVNK